MTPWRGGKRCTLCKSFLETKNCLTPGFPESDFFLQNKVQENVREHKNQVITKNKSKANLMITEMSSNGMDERGKEEVERYRKEASSEPALSKQPPLSKAMLHAQEYKITCKPKEGAIYHTVHKFHQLPGRRSEGPRAEPRCAARPRWEHVEPKAEVRNKELQRLPWSGQQQIPQGIVVPDD
ncbi:hypothetical protein Anapl_18170 [Anas platyrhynchos]|uniref:Uncharacterized protein n=1 Tax=Anas platyrhynchos TaxID=8839 RepID=R0KX68_ANAPL|nr:hypothetical protein Anapl_18170 [Anas platyrhynchos]